MADKEERIIIAVAEPSLLEGGADKIYPCMTRQEAIEVMAKAMCLFPYSSCEYCIVEKNKEACKQAFEVSQELAETALNALLGVEK